MTCPLIIPDFGSLANPGFPVDIRRRVGDNFYIGRKEKRLEKNLTRRTEKIVAAAGLKNPASAGEEAMNSSAEKGAGPGRVALGSDHGGFPLKERISAFLTEKGYLVKDCGTDSTAACDYPDYAARVARAVASGDCDRGIMIDSIGVASAMAANKVKGIRAAACWDLRSASSSREHNNANVLTLGGKVLEDRLALEMVSTWLTTPFAGGRHWPRVNKIMALERS